MNPVTKRSTTIYAKISNTGVGSKLIFEQNNDLLDPKIRVTAIEILPAEKLSGTPYGTPLAAADIPKASFTFVNANNEEVIKRQALSTLYPSNYYGFKFNIAEQSINATGCFATVEATGLTANTVIPIQVYYYVKNA